MQSAVEVKAKLSISVDVAVAVCNESHGQSSESEAESESKAIVQHGMLQLVIACTRSTSYNECQENAVPATATQQQEHEEKEQQQKSVKIMQFMRFTWQGRNASWQAQGHTGLTKKHTWRQLLLPAACCMPHPSL